MIELCELKLIENQMDYWSPDIDQHVAELDFDNSSMMIDQSLFGSAVECSSPDQSKDYVENDNGNVASKAQGGVVISTDSLDMELIRDCVNNKNDYKLTFEDSGQWTTTSGIGTSVTKANNNNKNSITRRTYHNHLKQRNNTGHYAVPYNTTNLNNSINNCGMLDRHFGLRLLEQLNNDEWSEAIGEANEEEKQKLIDNLLNNVATAASSTDILSAKANVTDNIMTTWGRIRNTELFDEKTYSLSEHKQRHQKQKIKKYADNIDECFRRSFFCSDVLLLPAVPPPLSSKTNNEKNETVVDVAICPNKLTNDFNYKAKTRKNNNENKPISNILSNFVEQHQLQSRPPDDYEYSEVYVGDGRYVDLNENEIGYVPENTSSIQKSLEQSSNISFSSNGDSNAHYNSTQRITSDVPSIYDNCVGPFSSFTQTANAPFQSKNTRRAINTAHGRLPNQRDIAPSFTAPDLKFLGFKHNVPSFLHSQVSLDKMLKKARNGSLLLNENLFTDEKILLDASSELSILDRNNVQPDSGLGSSSSSGPSHIEDWPSLAVLLPRHVVDACSFFKTNSSLLTGSSTGSAGGGVSSSNNIEKKILPRNSNNLVKSKTTSQDNDHNYDNFLCMNNKKRHTSYFSASHRQKKRLCDCVTCCYCLNNFTANTTSEITQREQENFTAKLLNSALSASALVARMPKLNSAELRVIGFPIYNSKRTLVERVVEGVAEIARGASAVVLWNALEELLADGLNAGQSPWNVIVAITGPGPATNNIYQLVKKLEVSEKPVNSRIYHFFKEVLSLHSLEGWLSYVVLKENVLSRLYVNNAFLLQANSSYRSLFWRLIESIELLSVLLQCQNHQKDLRQRLITDTALTDATDRCNDTEQCWTYASCLPNDSRIPKSSSLPEKMESSKVIGKKLEKKYSDDKVIAPSTTNKIFMSKNANNCYKESTPSTSTTHILKNKKIQDTTEYIFPQTASPAVRRRCASRIPILRLHSNNNSVRSQSTLISSPTSTLHSRSLHSRLPRLMTPNPIIVTRVRESVVECSSGANSQKWLLLEKGEQVRVLSIRGDLSRCCRLHSRHGFVLNGTVPTHKLDLH